MRIFGSTLTRTLLKVCFCAMLFSVPSFAQMGTIPLDVTAEDMEETALGTGMIKNFSPLAPGQTPPLWASDMVWAAQHDARWAAASASHAVGMNSRTTSMLAKGNTFFIKVGDTFGKVLGAYQEITKMIEVYSAMKNAWEFMQNYKLTVNLYRFLPVINVDAPNEMGGGQAFAVGIFPKDSTGWEARANILNDNIWRRPMNGLRLVEVRYPHSIGDLLLDPSIWGSDSVDEETFQKMLLSGMYDGVMSSSQWLSNAGIGNNMADNVANMGPKAFARRISIVVMKRIVDLQARKDYLYQVSIGAINMPKDMTPTLVLGQMAAIDIEIAKLQVKDTTGYASAQMKQQVWMRQASFVGEILAKLEHTERRLALMKLRERYNKYEVFWATPNMMNPTPEITGVKSIDDPLNLIWSSLSVLSEGKIPPPTPVAGGPAAKAQATMVRSMYRELMVDELRAVRRLLAFRYAQDKQKQASNTQVEEAKDEVNKMLAVLDARADHIKRMNQYAEERKIIYAANEGWVFDLPGI